MSSVAKPVAKPLTSYEIFRVYRLMSIAYGVKLEFFQEVMKREYGNRVAKRDMEALLWLLVEDENYGYRFEYLMNLIKGKYRLDSGKRHYRNLQHKEKCEAKEGVMERAKAARKAITDGPKKLSKGQRRRANRKKRKEEEAKGESKE